MKNNLIPIRKSLDSHLNRIIREMDIEKVSVGNYVISVEVNNEILEFWVCNGYSCFEIQDYPKSIRGFSPKTIDKFMEKISSQLPEMWRERWRF